MKEIKNYLNVQNQFLIERRGELDEVMALVKGKVGHGDTHLDDLYQNVVKGIVDMPTAYPYVLTLEYEPILGNIYTTFVTLEHFKDSGELFEFELKRTSTQSPYAVKFSRYQIPAKDIFEAHLKLGQTFNDAEAYELEVVSFNKVK